MAIKVYKTSDKSIIDIPEGIDNYELLEFIVNDRTGTINDVTIENATFTDFALVEEHVENFVLKDCKLRMINLEYMDIVSMKIIDCEIEDCSGLDNDNIVIIGKKLSKLPSNDEIAKIVKGKVYTLPNQEYVKIDVECDFCHNHFVEIQKRNKAHMILNEIPNCEKRVCDSCFKHYEIRTKFVDCRAYGYRGPISFFRTPMDRKDTEILGLEMEFEGDFYGWKELQDAHGGLLHYGYDSSVRGNNELSWDCGSYSWWKYLAPLDKVCKALRDNGGSEGPTAGIHIHVSSPNTNPKDVTMRINSMCRSGVMNILMRAVCLRKDKSKFERYANLDCPAGEHHAGISYNSHKTCEFRIFASSLNEKLIIKHLKFCKEVYNLASVNVSDTELIKNLSKETKKHILTCAKTQIVNGFITEGEFKSLKETMELK